MSCVTRAYEFLEAREPGLFNALIRHAMLHQGIVHAAPDCFFIGVPAEDDPRAVAVLFQCSELPALWRMAAMYRDRFDTVRFRRDFKHAGFGEHSVPMSRLLMRAGLASTSYHIHHA